MTISYIPAGVPFLETLAKYVLQKIDPLQLPQCQILLPTQRACEALKQALLKCRGQATLLPKIQALGNLNAEDIVLQGASLQLLKGKISERRRHLLLTHLIATHRKLTTDQAGLLATTLLQLLDAISREGITLDHLDLNQLVSAEYALHWQITQAFLKIIQQEWPQVFAAETQLERYPF